MKKYFLIILVTLISCNKEKEKFEVTDKVIYEVINFMLAETKINDSLEGFQYNYIIDKTIKPTFFEEEKNFEIFNKYFNKSDFKFMKKQLIRNKDFKLEQNKIIRKKIIQNDSLEILWNKNLNIIERKIEYLNKYKMKYCDTLYQQYSLPLFSLDGKKVYIEKNSFLGFGQRIVLIKTKNGWKSKIVSTWIN